jgi:hypothetical protein
MNLWGIIKGLLVQDATDRTKEFSIEVDPAAATGTRTTLKAAQTANRELTLPDNDSELVDIDSAQTLENKTMDFSSSGNNTLTADASDVLFDNAASGLVAGDVQGAIDEVEGRLDTVETGLSDHLSDASDAHDASAISSVPAGSLASTDVQAALNELDGDRQQVSTDLSNHISDLSDAHDASAISNIPAGNLAATDVQAALDELQSDVDTRATQTDLNNHLNDATDAHDASAISNVPTGNLAATDVQGALNELQGDIDALVSGSSTASNLGTGAEIFKQQVLNDLQFRSIKAGPNIIVTQNADEIEIEGAASGAATDLSNLSPTSINENLIFDNTTNKLISIEAETIAGDGKTLTLQGGNAFDTSNSGGSLILKEGISTGNVISQGIEIFLNNRDTVGAIPNTQSRRFQFIGGSAPSFKMYHPDSTDLVIRTATNQFILESNDLNSSSDTTSLSLVSGDNSGTGGSGDVQLSSGAVYGIGTSGQAGFGSGQATSGGNSGSVIIGSGNASLASGELLLQTGTGTSRGNVTVNAKNLVLASATVSTEATALVHSSKESDFISGTINQLNTENHSLYILEPSALTTINGIKAGVQGQQLILWNKNAFNVTFNNENGGASAQDRITTQSGAAVTLTTQGAVMFVYSNSRWNLISFVG